MSQFLELLPNDGTRVTILDVGGLEGFWTNVWTERLHHASITLLNPGKEQISGKLPIVSLGGNARDLSPERTDR
jgi:hypothetical protein